MAEWLGHCAFPIAFVARFEPLPSRDILSLRHALTRVLFQSEDEGEFVEKNFYNLLFIHSLRLRTDPEEMHVQSIGGRKRGSEPRLAFATRSWHEKSGKTQLL